MDSIEARNRVYEATTARGYTEGWTHEEFAARQVCKLIEELAELAETIQWPNNKRAEDMAVFLGAAGNYARKLFDDKAVWTGTGILNYEQCRKEAADLQVVLFNLAAALGFDVVADAVAKAEKDQERGVR